MATLNAVRSGDGMFEGGVWIFYVEALLALALGLFIVWWTLPKKKAPDATSRNDASPDSAVGGDAGPERARDAESRRD